AGCAAVAGLLHFFLLAAFSWTCLEGIQILLLVLVSKVDFKTLFMMAGGYGVPAVIVAVSAAVKGDGYGTRRHCWLNVNLIWSFFGPAGVFITVNFLVFLVTVWKLAQKLSTLSPQTDHLLKIKLVTNNNYTKPDAFNKKTRAPVPTAPEDFYFDNIYDIFKIN
ncbi:adhesion G protein-coupled receptor E4-like, partial [Plectropomus leopardus]|uniref:adhesion G protein-coupled receptor E4-like n=1 Tax=Plectropomus leopardus TaxID=160734 RepID=UPI001C4B2957